MKELRAATSHQFEYILAGTFQPENIDRVVEDLASHNYNAVQVCVRAPGVHYYPTDLAPVHPYCRDYDFLGDFVAKAHAAGLQIHSYYPVFLEGDVAASAATGAGLQSSSLSRQIGGALAEHPEWATLGAKTGDLRPDNWGCPANPGYVEYVQQLAVEQVTRYDLDAMVWDFIRYRCPCYCEHCRAGYREFTGGEDLNTRWPTPQESEFRCQVVLEDLRQLNAAVRAARPGIKIGAYTFPFRRAAIAGVFQDWLAFSLECDFIQPMYYGVGSERLRDALRLDAKLAHCPLALGLLPSLGEGVERGTEDALCEDIQIAREAGYQGFFMLSYEPLFGWEAAGTYSGPFWHTPHPEGAARRITDRVLSEPATLPF